MTSQEPFQSKSTVISSLESFEVGFTLCLPSSGEAALTRRSLYAALRLVLLDRYDIIFVDQVESPLNS